MTDVREQNSSVGVQKMDPSVICFLTSVIGFQ